MFGNLDSHILFATHAVPIWAGFGRYLANCCPCVTVRSPIELPSLSPTRLTFLVFVATFVYWEEVLPSEKFNNTEVK